MALGSTRLRGGRRWLNELAAGVAVLVSLVSLWVGVRTEQANRKMVDANYRMVAASSWPYLQLESGNGDDNGKPTITLELKNAGVGPAKVETFELFWKGKAYANAKELLEACCADPKLKAWAVSTSPPKDFVLRAGDTQRFLGFPRTDENGGMWDKFDRVRFSELTYRVCYCSVFDECWVTHLTTLKAQPVKQCPIPAVPFGELAQLGAGPGAAAKP
jgi:hypothetical protein